MTKKPLLVFKGTADNDSDYSARSAKAYGLASMKDGKLANSKTPRTSQVMNSPKESSVKFSKQDKKSVNASNNMLLTNASLKDK